MSSGIVIIDKPGGWTSMDVCAKLRGILKERRIGHGGTLDPLATGVLPVFVGSATKAVEFAEKGDKEYLAGLRLGVETNTQDITGQVLSTRPVTAGQAELEGALPAFTGPIMQVPPMYSAIKRNGQKLYELARAGKEVHRDPRPVTIHALTLLGRTEEGDYLLRVRCSKGTYVRTLCHDIGAALGCGGCMSSLRRTMAAGAGGNPGAGPGGGGGPAAAGGPVLRRPPGLPHPLPPAGAPLPQRQPPPRAGAGGGGVPGVRSPGDLSVREPVGAGPADTGEEFLRLRMKTGQGWRLHP